MRGVPPPGVYADYGYLLIKKGEIQKRAGVLEIRDLYLPESKPFIRKNH